MRFIPRHKFEMITPFDIKGLNNRLNRNIRRNQEANYMHNLPTTRDGKLLEGTVTEDGFEVKEYVNKKDSFYKKNWFEAVANGTYFIGQNKTSIQVNLKIAKGSATIFWIWFALVCFVIVSTIAQMITTKSVQGSYIGLLILSLVMLIAGYLMMLFSFRTSAHKLELRLREILERGKVF